MWVIYVILGLIVLLAIVWVAAYNRLVGLREQARNAWSQIDVQLKRRSDMIPNLVETVKGYASHESHTLEAVIAARNAAISAGSVAERGTAENALTGALKTLFAVAEAYPNLKANENFLRLQEEIAHTEDKIAYARQHYNDVVSVYNTSIKTVPGNLIAGMGGFGPQAYLEMAESERSAPRISFNAE